MNLWAQQMNERARDVTRNGERWKAMKEDLEVRRASSRPEHDGSKQWWELTEYVHPLEIVERDDDGRDVAVPTAQGAALLSFLSRHIKVGID